MIENPGRAHWLYDEHMETHLPACAQLNDEGFFCLNGPLVGEQIETGDCGEH